MKKTVAEGARLITDWESPGAIAGTMIKRTKTSCLSPDGNTTYVESARSAKDPMIFTKDK